ncbi:MAG: hypothetical protein LAO24_24395 [Acidobacteriia bacterium]|nr:hypothetical protein [Terriglobia bacterium]
MYWYISYIADLAIKAGCIAHLAAALVRIDPKAAFEPMNKIHSISAADLKADVKLLLDTTGQHNTATRRVIEALSSTKPEAALDICLSLNVQARRDMALRTLLSSMLRQRVQEIPFLSVSAVLERFADPDEVDEALTEVVERFSIVKKPEILELVADNIVPILGRVINISSAQRRTETACLALQILKRVDRPANEGLEKVLERTLTVAWDSMDDDWRRVEAAFYVTSAMAVCCRSLALEYLHKAEALRNSVALEHPTLSYGAAMYLAGRAYAGVLAMKLEAEEDLRDLTERVGRLPSLTSRILVWIDVALRLIAHSRGEDARQIVEEKLVPQLLQLERKDVGEWCSYVVACSPALYIAHAKSSLELIARLPVQWQSPACEEVIDFICRKVPSNDPYETSEETWHRLTYNEITDIIDVLQLVRSDAFIYVCVKRIVDTARKQKPPLSQQQKAAIVQRLTDLIKTKLPSPIGIRHKGWLIVCEAELLRIQKDAPHAWDRIITELKGIPNTSDRAYASAMVARAMWGSDPIGAGHLFKEGLSITDTIPSLFHRVDMYQEIADFAAAVDPEFAKAALSRAVEMTLGNQDSDLEQAQKAIVDSASVLSADLSSHLAALIDNDPARAHAKVKAKRQLELEEFRKKMLDESVNASELFTTDTKRIPESAWTNLGALNANRVEPVPLRHTRDYIRAASMLPLSESYPVFSWAIENAVRRLMLGTKEQARTTLRGLFRATLQSCDLSSWVASKMSGRAQRPSQAGQAEPHVVQAGEREGALGKIRKWIAENGTEYLKVSDQFIGPEELLEIVRIVLSSERRIRVYVVTSRKYQLTQKVSVPWDDAYRLHWRLFSDQDPPDTQVVIAGLANGDSPLHDRWWITKGAGLRLGTSFNSLGMSKVSELTPIDGKQLAEFESEIDSCIASSKRGMKGERVVYSSFTL